MESNPQIPNPEELRFIHPKANPQNPARYEAAPEELTPPVPVVTLGPNAVYLVQPGYWDEKAEGIKPPEESETLTLTSLNPNELPVWAADTEVFWNGSGFTESSVIVWNDGQEVTKFISATKLSTIVKPSTVQVAPPFVIQTYVLDSGKESEKLAFTFIA